jgi:hypothetical protein
MSKASLQGMMSKRTPLAQRDIVMPTNLYTNPQVDETTSPRMEKSTKPLVEKYTTHLRPETIKAIKRQALEEDHKDYEVVQCALDEYLARIGEQAARANND